MGDARTTTVTATELKAMTKDGVEKYDFTAGETLRYWVKIKNTGLLPAMPKDVYLFFGPKGGPLQRVATIRTGWISPWGEETHTYDYVIPTSTPAGFYWIGAKTEEDTTTIVREIRVFEPAPPGMGRLDIKTNPSGATIYVDGVKVGVSPIMVDVDPGTHDIRVELSGYKVKEAFGAEVISEDTVRTSVGPDETKTVVITLEPSPVLWRSAMMWGLAGLALGAGVALLKKKRPEYIQREVRR